MNYLGYFGKLPEKGDFILDGIGMDEREAWDAWLQEGIAAARGSLGEVWRKSYVHRTVWRFLAHGEHGRRSGVMLFSHDRVGREFPFVVLFGDTADASGSAGAGTADIDMSLAFAERLVVAAFDGLVPVEQLAMLLRNLPWRYSQGQTLIRQEGALAVHVPSAPESSVDLEAVLLQSFLAGNATGPGSSLWWRCAADGRPSRAVVSREGLTSRLLRQLLAEQQVAVVAGDHPDSEALSGSDSVPGARSGSNVAPRVAADPRDDDPVDFNTLLG